MALQTIIINSTDEIVEVPNAQPSVSIPNERTSVDVGDTQGSVVAQRETTQVEVSQDTNFVVVERKVAEILEIGVTAGVAPGLYVPIAGGTMTGPLILSGNPVSDLQAVPRQYLAWGNIQGTLSNQTDLQSALNAKLSVATASTTYAALDASNQPFSSPIRVTNYLYQDVNGNNAFGYLAGGSVTTGLYNYFSGTLAGESLTEGSYNWIGGYRAGQKITTANYNFLGGHAAGGNLVDGNSNVYLGYNAGLNNVSGVSNVAIGFAAQQEYTSNYGIAIGNFAARYATGGNVVAIGYQAYSGINGQSTGGQVIAVGTQASSNNTTGIRLISIGYRAAYRNTGSNNVVVGDQAGEGISGSAYNRSALMGTFAGQDLTTGNDNVMFGYVAGSLPAKVSANASTTASRSVFVGAYSGLGSTTQRTNAIAIGYYAVVDNDNTCVIGGQGANAVDLRITKNLIVGNGVTTTSRTDNFAYLPTSAGAPTGVPTSYTGGVAAVVDTTNNRLYIYNGSWKYITLT